MVLAKKSFDLCVFGPTFNAAETIAMRYFGSKGSTASQVLRLCLSDMRVDSAADAFGGIGTIGLALRSAGVRVSACDLLSFPHAFQYARIVCSRPPRFVAVRRALGLPTSESVICHLNAQRLTNSWIVRDFAQHRRFFTTPNAEAIAGVWHRIRRWDHQGLLSQAERHQLIAGLVNSADLVANTAGTYYAYLKSWHRKALRPFELRLLDIPKRQPAGEALLGDAFDCLAGRSFDLLYLDPPYNSRDYARYYHLPETMASLVPPQTTAGSLSGVPEGTGDASRKFRQALKLDYIERLASSIGWRRLVVQYCDGAYIPLNELRKYLASVGKMKEHLLPALGYTTASRPRTLAHHVFVIDKVA